MKRSIFSIQQWQDIVNQYQDFNGTINQFCELKGITRTQLYYYRKKFSTQNSVSTEFCQVTLESTKVIQSSQNNNITFNIGKNTITVPSTQKELIIEIVKELVALC